MTRPKDCYTLHPACSNRKNVKRCKIRATRGTLAQSRFYKKLSHQTLYKPESLKIDTNDLEPM